MSAKCEVCGAAVRLLHTTDGTLPAHEPGDYECVKQQLANVTADRDALLAACLESLVVMTMNGSNLVDPSRAIRMASEAIEKARGV